MEWKYEKFIGDGAVYATCGACGYTHCCSSWKDGGIVIDRLFLFCPMCGNKATNTQGPDIEVVWNERFPDSLTGKIDECGSGLEKIESAIDELLKKI